MARPLHAARPLHVARLARLARLVLLALVVFGATGCRKLLAALGKGDDAGIDAASVVASADPGASATAAVTASAPIASTSAAVTAKVAPKPGAKKAAVPKCPKGQSLFAEDDSSPLFCSRSCEKDADCKPSKCNQTLFNGDETGAIFTGVGKQVFACDCGFGAAPAASASAGPSASSVVLAIPPGGPGVIQNPNGQPCPVGYSNAGGVLKTCNKKCEGGAKCPAGSKCSDVLLVCR